MALYKVSRTDVAGPGEFVTADVIAGGTALARKAVAHMKGVTATNVAAARIDISGRDVPVQVLSAYWDESPTLSADAVSDAFDVPRGLVGYPQ